MIKTGTEILADIQVYPNFWKIVDWIALHKYIIEVCYTSGFHPVQDENGRHKFSHHQYGNNPFSFTLFQLLAESHVIVTTFPERDMLFLNIWSCSREPEAFLTAFLNDIEIIDIHYRRCARMDLKEMQSIEKHKQLSGTENS